MKFIAYLNLYSLQYLNQCYKNKNSRKYFMVIKNNDISKKKKLNNFEMLILSYQMFYSRKLWIIHVHLFSGVKKNLINPRADDFVFFHIIM